MKKFKLNSILLGSLILCSASVSAEKLRLLTWDGYTPNQVVALFEHRYPDIEVEVTYSNNEEMVKKLQTIEDGGYDLAQPSHDRVYGAQIAHDIYKPIDMTKINTDNIDSHLLDAVKANTTIEGEVYSFPHVWGTTGLVVDTHAVKDFNSWADICDPKYKGQTSMRLTRTMLLGMAFSMGENPFEAYADSDMYQAILDKVVEKLIACKGNIKGYWKDAGDLSQMIISEQIIAAETWDNIAYKVYALKPEIKYLPPKEGALGWIDTFSLPKNGKADDAAYKWINFVFEPDIARLISQSSGAISSAANGIDLLPSQTRDAVNAAFDAEAIENLKYFANIPPGVEEMESKALEKIKAAD
jgi:spermidine/putrescine transport system substrate-binding protein